MATYRLVPVEELYQYPPEDPQHPNVKYDLIDLVKEGQIVAVEKTSRWSKNKTIVYYPFDHSLIKSLQQ